MFEPLSPMHRLPRAAGMRILVAAGLCLGPRTLHADTALCTLTFSEAVQSSALNDSARGCLNRAAAEYRDHPGAHITLTGPLAARVSAARQYLLNQDSIPAAAILASTAPGNPGFVQVTLALATQAEVQPEAPRKDLNHLDQGGALAKPAPAPPAPPPAPAPAAVPVPLAPAPAPVQAGPPPKPAPVPAGAAPAVHPQPGVAPPPAPGAHPGAADPYADGEQVEDWERRLKSGGIDFNRPGTMVVGKPTGIVVVVHGYLDQSHADLPGVVGQGTLKVSDNMRVDLDAPLAPGEFQITPAQGASLPVPINGSATWEFQVTPTNVTSDPQTLVIHPYLIPPGRYGAQPLEERNFTVQVTVEPFWRHIHDLWKDDPIKVVKYLLPGGEGFSGIGAFFTGLIALLTSLGIIAWIKRRFDARDNPTKGPANSP